MYSSTKPFEAWLYSDASRQSHHLFYRWTVNYLSYTATRATYERNGNERY